MMATSTAERRAGTARVVAIVQARMGSSRLPGKVLKDLAGTPMLGRVLSRLARAETLNEVVVATSVEEQDGRLAAWCAANDWPCYRGSEDDVLDRYYQAARQTGAEIVVRVTADCPLTDPDVVDRVVRELQGTDAAVYGSNAVPDRTFPRGLDTEAFYFSALAEAWAEAEDPADREHVTPFLWRQPDRFPQVLVKADDDFSGQRWTVDTPEDYAFVQRVYEHFGHDRFSWREVLEAVRTHPEWTALNAHVQQKTV